MTEDEAKTKWCPFVRAYASDGNGEAAAINRSGLDIENQCIGSACMAWRTVQPPDGETRIDAIRRHRAENNSHLREAKEFVEANPAYVRQPSRPHGYCGLAGAPQ